MYAYDNFLQFVNPCEDMVAFLKACAPIAYTDYGKAISHYGGLRIAPLQAIEYAGCGRAKQIGRRQRLCAGYRKIGLARYAAAEAIELLTAEQPRKRSPPRRDEIIGYIRNLTQGLDVKFEAVVDGDREIRYGQSTEEVSAAPPMPEETAADENAQPEEEDEAEILNAGIRQGIMEQVGDMVNFLERGRIQLGDREHAFCADVSMDVETGSAASSTTRRPKAKASPRQPTVLADVMLMRYDNPRNLAIDVARRRGKFLACGVDIAETGLASQDAVGRLIEELADTRDRQLSRRGDQPRFAMDVETGRYVNEGYSCVSDNVRGGTLDLMPLDGAQFIHEFWGEVKTCRPRDLTSQVWKNSGWALHCIQMYLRHHIGRVSGTTTLDGRDSVVLHDVIKCDEGGWVLIDDLVRKDILWSSSSRRITQSAANLRDRDQRLRVYNE
eukprot:s3243_g9.t1